MDLDILLDDLGELRILLPSEKPWLSLLGMERFCQLSLINGERWGKLLHSWCLLQMYYEELCSTHAFSSSLNFLSLQNSSQLPPPPGSSQWDFLFCWLQTHNVCQCRLGHSSLPTWPAYKSTPRPALLSSAFQCLPHLEVANQKPHYYIHSNIMGNRHLGQQAGLSPHVWPPRREEHWGNLREPRDQLRIWIKRQCSPSQPTLGLAPSSCKGAGDFDDLKAEVRHIRKGSLSLSPVLHGS